MCAAQVRLPIADIPTIISKLCSRRLSWADLHRAHGAHVDGAPSAGGGAAAGGGGSSEEMISYLGRHGVTQKLNAAVNALAAAQPDDPMAFLVSQLSK